MGNKLLVRSYNVGCGDCFYVRIPNGNDDFHILIDCGSKEGANSGVMKRSIRHLKDKMLPSDGNGKKRLDLIVVTHRHEDHIKGFNPSFFKNIAIKNIWLPVAMKKDHPQAQQSFALHSYAANEIRELAKSNLPLSPELEDLVSLFGVNNDNAVEALTETLPLANGIDVDYVFAGKSSDDYGIQIEDTKIHVLGPEFDIDEVYLGEISDRTLTGLKEVTVDIREQKEVKTNTLPSNISNSEFRKLKSRLLSNGLAFAVDDSSIQNNVSTIILIEWSGRRLLFVGDAEWNSGYKKGRKNCSWNVMWEKRNDHLSQPIDFLKVGHHGSHNATPWNRDKDDSHEVNKIFNSILPKPKNNEQPTAQCLVSTKRKQYDTIPDPELLVELGKRVSNTKNYFNTFDTSISNFEPENHIFNYSILKEYSKEPSPREVGEDGWFDKNQPMRTDMESKLRGAKIIKGRVEFIDVEIEPK